MEQSEEKSIEQLIDDFELECERINDRIYDFRIALDTFLDRLSDTSDALSKMPDNALNKVVSFGFVPGVKVRFSSKDGVKEYAFVGYDCYGHMTFQTGDGKRIGADIGSVAQKLDNFELITEDKDR